MRALTFSRFGDPSVLEVREVADPVAAPGVAVVRTRAIGLNFADVYRRQGRYHLVGEPPWIAGYEAAGELAALAASDTGAWRIGQRVAFADTPHANAELVAVPLDHLIPLPDDIDAELAAALLLQGLTADYLVRDSYAVQSGDRIVVHAAAGGVGLLLVQLARALGAEVIGLASSETKRAAASRAGAAHVIDSRGDWPAAVGRIFPDGVHAVYDSIGTTLLDSLRVARVGGTVVFYGMAGGEPPAVDPRLLMDRSLRLVGGDLWNVLRTAEDRRQRAARLFAEVRAGRLAVTIDERFPLARGGDAHRALEGRERIGKLLLVP
ncbi:MAG TPA: zinc-binding dehydrogenase [Kofleriaceae bacterium]|nr:zinc-binding dehydrogenase [Kofleriaceae bacterium]